MKNRSRWALSLAAIAALVASTACVALASAEGSFERTLKVNGPVDLDVQTGSGSISVRTGATDSVQVRARVVARDSTGARAEEKVKQIESNPPIEQNGNIIRIGRMDEWNLRQNVSISYEITTPPDTRLRAHSGSGHQNMDGIRGPLDIEAGSGGMKISNIGGEVRAHTGSGSIELASIQGAVRAEAGSGSITADRIAGAFDGRTGSGHIRMSQTAPGDVRVQTGSGGAEIEGIKGGLRAGSGSGHIAVSGEPTAMWDVHTGSGGITFRVAPQANFDLEARTGSGGIRTDRPMTVQGSVGRHELRAKVGNGGPLVQLRTGSGGITIQ